ncbi:hypothetical protein [Actinokineospora inagensis]|uniref:hypothetical protein n=1 Tax=Actinokineospora inagensis TaxID=103730 RepID=UPI0003F99A9C|nr:hypothetical protein [Actinokineospora inagensis]
MSGYRVIPRAAANGEITSRTGRVRVRFTAVNRETTRPDPVAATIAIAVPMSAGDLAALAWLAIQGDNPDEWLADFEADPQLLHAMLCEALLACGGHDIADTRALIESGHRDGPDRDLRDRLYAVIEQIYGGRTAPVASSRGGRGSRLPVGVA